ncbi:lycopene cyclase family protein [Allosphingosinicella sp.]|uniref:lycopene cyclase family protein n=1 Tax=Allosphingosinicella sp. TaxID=2823234 RepID=UPI00378338AF
MPRGRRDGILIAGGGLAGALAALALARHRPDVPLLLVEEGETFGGAGTRTFSDAELGTDGAGLIGPERIMRWPGIYLSFPGMNRNLRLDWSGLGGGDLHEALVATLDPKQYRLGTRIVAVREDAIILDDGEELKAEGAIDARGTANLSMLELLHEVRVERDYVFAAPHRVDRPVLIDATVPQDGALRFMSCVPLDERRLVVADVMISERIQPDAEADARLDAYVAARGWRTPEAEGEEVSVRPLPYGGDFAAFWRLGGARVAKLGLRGGFVHPLTGRTLSDSVANAMLLTRQRDFSAGALHDLFEAEAKQAWKRREPMREVTAAFAAARPEHRLAMLASLYALGPGTIAALNADTLGWLDRRRVQQAISS